LVGLLAHALRLVHEQLPGLAKLPYKNTLANVYGRKDLKLACVFDFIGSNKVLLFPLKAVHRKPLFEFQKKRQSYK